MTGACSLCTSQRVEHVGDLHRRFYSKNGLQSLDMPIHVCASCGFAFVNPIPSQETLVDLHRNVYYPSWGLNEAILRHARDVFDTVKHHVPLGQCRNMLDIGCGEGALLETFQRHGIQATGVDVREEIDVERLKSLGIELYQQPFHDVRFPECYDIIVLDNVLEHLPDPLTTLREVRNLLSPAGYLVILVPYVAPQASGTFIQEHVNFFSPQTIENACALCGLLPVLKPDHNLETSIYQNTLEARLPTVVNDYAYVSSTIHNFILHNNAVERNGFAKLQDTLDALFAQGKRILFYGAGSYALNILENVRLHDTLFVGIVDSNQGKVGQKLLTHTIFGANDIELLAPDGILICTDNVYFVEEISTMLKARFSSSSVRILTMDETS